jgi:hypothetical protein
MSQPSLEQILETHIQTLALTLRRDTVTNYRCVARRFLLYLRAAFPRVRLLSQLRRDPHLLGWFRWMCEQEPPLCNKTRGDYLLGLRRLLDDLAANSHAIQPDLIRREDFPPLPRYLPRPLSPQDESTAAAGTAPYGRSRGECAPAHSCYRNPHRRRRCMFQLASCTPNAWCRPMQMFDKSWLAFWLCALWLRPRDWPSPMACCCHVWAVITLFTRLCSGL